MSLTMFKNPKAKWSGLHIYRCVLFHPITGTTSKIFRKRLQPKKALRHDETMIDLLAAILRNRPLDN